MKAVLLLHGFATDQRDFDPIIPALSTLYQHISRIILPGHGEGAHEKDFEPEKTIICVENEMTRLEKEYDIIDIIGFSMGGALASHLTKLHHPHKLVLLSPANQYLNPQMILSNLQTYLDYYGFQMKHRKSTNPMVLEEKAKRKEYIHDINQDHKTSFSMMVHQLLPRYTIHGIKTFIRVIQICNDQLKEIDCPTLLIWGKLDQLVPKTTIDFYQKRCSKLTVVTYDEFSHLMLYSKQNQKIMDTCITFLKNE